MRKYFDNLICFLFCLTLLCSGCAGKAQQVEEAADSIAISYPTAGSVVGGENIKILHKTKLSDGVTISEIQTQITEIGDPALSLSLSNDSNNRGTNDADTNPVSWNSLPMHNGPCKITSRAILRKGDKYFTVQSVPITVTVQNLWITATSPANAFFAIKLNETKKISVDFDHFLAKGPYRVEYNIYHAMIVSNGAFRTIVHENVTGHHDQCDIIADKDSLPYGAYISFDIKVSCQGDEATLVSPICKGITDNSSNFIESSKIHLVYTLSEPPAPGGLSILCYSNLKLITTVKDLSEQCRDWENPVIIDFDFHQNSSFRSIYIGWDNNKNNRGRTSQPIMPWS